MDEKLKSYEQLLDIMDKLREECPWDRKQTIESLRSHTIEECFELTDAISRNDFDNIKEELGDLLLHIVFYAKIADEQARFSIKDVTDAINHKLIYRHPHVFGEVSVHDADEVTHNWEILKQKEKKKKKEGVLSGVPKGLPALIKAFRIQQKAAGIGFDWKDKKEVWNKVKEEIGEFEKELHEQNSENMEKEFGDILFALINAARLYGIDPETALEKTNQKFISRFNHMETVCKEKEKNLAELSLDEMEELWIEAKNNE